MIAVWLLLVNLKGWWNVSSMFYSADWREIALTVKVFISYNVTPSTMKKWPYKKDDFSWGQEFSSIINKGNNKITELRTILQRESQNS